MRRRRQTGETAKTDAAATPAAGGAAATPDDGNGATITGKVAFTGDKPKMKTLDMSANPGLRAAHTDSREIRRSRRQRQRHSEEHVRVGQVAGLPADKTWQVPTTPVVLDQNGCMYKPHVIGVMAGQNIDIKNSDPTNHNIHPLPTINRTGTNRSRRAAPPITQDFARQEVMIPVKCNVHPWMRAYIGVVAQSVLRRDGRRRNVYNKRTASRDLHHSNRPREVRQAGAASHCRRQGQQDRRLHREELTSAPLRGFSSPLHSRAGRGR